MEKDKSLKSERQKQNYEAMEPSKKRYNVIRKKRARNTANNLELQKKGAKQFKTMDSAKTQMVCQKLLIFLELM